MSDGYFQDRKGRKPGFVSDILLAIVVMMVLSVLWAPNALLSNGARGNNAKSGRFTRILIAAVALAAFVCACGWAGHQVLASSG